MTAVHSQVQEEHAYSDGSVHPEDARLGANWRNQRCEFTIWAPFAKRVDIQLVRRNLTVQLEAMAQGYFGTKTEEFEPDEQYYIHLDKGSPRGDPASRFQPEGVFGPSSMFDASTFHWTDTHWRGIELKDYVLYELHVGAYTLAGTFDSLCDKIAYLKSLGVTAIEIMPVAQFSGKRNWGYDGVFPFAVQNTYGGPRALQRLVDACHGEGLAVVLDVVYNHLGPEGNFLSEFGPYFTDRYQTPWGSAINFDGPQSDHVVRYFVENAMYWLEHCHVDALRLDAIHGIFDRNARPFLWLLSAAVDEFARRRGKYIYLIAESDLNDPVFVAPREDNGYGLHAQWNDDFHHALHALQTGERTGYYRDFGSLSHVRSAFQDGYVYRGQYSDFRQRRHGASPANLKGSQLIVFSQNHDQVGNRGWGERSSVLIDLERLKLSACAVLLSPFIPLLFMGEEYGETAPFLYFTDHSDPALAKAVRDGRRSEFAGFHGNKEVADPQAETTFLSSKLDHTLSRQGNHNVLLEFYRELLRLRKAHAPWSNVNTANVESSIVEDCLAVQLVEQTHELVLLLNFSDVLGKCSFPPRRGHWSKVLDSAEQRWEGPGSSIPSRIYQDSPLNLELAPKSFCAFAQEGQDPRVGGER